MAIGLPSLAEFCSIPERAKGGSESALRHFSSVARTDETIKENCTDWKQSIEGGLDARTVAETIYFAFSQLQSVNIREIALAPTGQQG